MAMTVCVGRNYCKCDYGRGIYIYIRKGETKERIFFIIILKLVYNDFPFSARRKRIRVNPGPDGGLPGVSYNFIDKERPRYVYLIKRGGRFNLNK